MFTDILTNVHMNVCIVKLLHSITDNCSRNAFSKQTDPKDIQTFINVCRSTKTYTKRTHFQMFFLPDFLQLHSNCNMACSEITLLIGRCLMFSKRVWATITLWALNSSHRCKQKTHNVNVFRWHLVTACQIQFQWSKWIAFVSLHN